MHEMSLCQNIMEIIDQQQKKHDIHEVTDILARNWSAVLCRAKCGRILL